MPNRGVSTLSLASQPPNMVAKCKSPPSKHSFDMKYMKLVCGHHVCVPDEILGHSVSQSLGVKSETEVPRVA